MLCQEGSAAKYLKYQEVTMSRDLSIFRPQIAHSPSALRKPGEKRKLRTRRCSRRQSSLPSIVPPEYKPSDQVVPVALPDAAHTKKRELPAEQTIPVMQRDNDGDLQEAGAIHAAHSKRASVDAAANPLDFLDDLDRGVTVMGHRPPPEVSRAPDNNRDLVPGARRIGRRVCGHRSCRPLRPSAGSRRASNAADHRRSMDGVGCRVRR
jgi:hypothetical protein